ncbi:uncharacterized protein N7473_001500 [Penicillium subrubescens]|uniref:G-protein coupled receptors family 1 profile domain-containing protein n=1 Tax=Penicillium subrubescens TaxID=1316194 RepID=A0A1Q5T8W2_9EURO|nr:uncharacterized protein N7473_001500 [Penicillium subrubescens]KAJ5912197.1 hypothetical protein N7473_001500 [Penicillium subrubescens]OKO96669.1 hypothetical protein PENSUB_10844 [Penicillium subrubescens]
MVMLIHALRALYADGGDSSLARRWEFREESPVEGTNRSLFIAMGVVAILSLTSTLGLLSFLTYRFIFWQRYYKRPLAQNQYVVLIYNLLLVDLQQAIAFLISLHWVFRGSVHFGETACYLQGWWIQIGDPGSGLFVLSIALHTGAVVLRGRQLPFRNFVYCVIALWLFILLLGFIPVGLYGSKAFVITEANWCWLSPENQRERLWGHYLWIFLSEFGTIVLYAIMFFYLRRRMKQAKILRRGQQESLQRLNRVVIYMVIYPVVYVLLSLPLAAGRMATAQGNSPSKDYFAVAGSLMALSGLMDVIVYTVTRRHLITDTEHSTTDRNYENTDSQWQTNITTAGGEGSRPRKGGFRMGSRLSSKFRKSMPTVVDKETRNSPFDDSTDDIVPKDDVEMNTFGVYQETTIEISHEPATPADTMEATPRRSG